MSSVSTIWDLNYLTKIVRCTTISSQFVIATSNFKGHILSYCLELFIFLSNNEQKGRFAVLQVFPQWPNMQKELTNSDSEYIFCEKQTFSKYSDSGELTAASQYLKQTELLQDSAHLHDAGGQQLSDESEGVLLSCLNFHTVKHVYRKS